MRTYGQYCPIARGAEIFAERWTPLIYRNMYLGCGSFSAILEGAPGLSRTVLSQRLKQLERLGVVESAPKPDARGRHYVLTCAGEDLFKVCVSLGEWGAAWLEIAPEHLDPFVALWSMCNLLRRDRLPERRVVIRFDFTGRQRPAERYWLLIERGDTEICKTYPGLDEDLFITAEAEAFVKWHAGQLSWAEAIRGPPHPAPRPLGAGTSLPHLERPQRLRTCASWSPDPRRARPPDIVDAPSASPQRHLLDHVGPPTRRVNALTRHSYQVMLVPRAHAEPRRHGPAPKRRHRSRGHLERARDAACFRTRFDRAGS